MKTQKKNQTDEREGWWSRDSIAFCITVGVVGATVFIAIYLVLYNRSVGADGKSFDMSFIGQTLLPLWGTWIGTVLAFYFGKANFEAANNAIKNMTPESKMASLLVKDEMIRQSDIVVLKYEDELSKNVKDILDYPQFKPYDRFAVFEKNNVVKAMIHRGTFYEFLFKNKDKENELTLKNLFEYQDANIQNQITFGFGFVKLDATVLDAKKVIDSIAECQDVFITQTGSRNEPVLGLLTNNKILEVAKV